MGQPNAPGTFAEVDDTYFSINTKNHARRYSQSYLGLTGATGTINCRDPLSLTCKRR